MGNFAEAGKIKDEMKKRDATRREKLAGYFFDLSKLIFAGMVIGLILPLLSDTEKRQNVDNSRIRYNINNLVGFAGK